MVIIGLWDFNPAGYKPVVNSLSVVKNHLDAIAAVMALKFPALEAMLNTGEYILFNPTTGIAENGLLTDASLELYANDDFQKNDGILIEKIAPQFATIKPKLKPVPTNAAASISTAPVSSMATETIATSPVFEEDEDVKHIAPKKFYEKILNDLYAFALDYGQGGTFFIGFLVRYMFFIVVSVFLVNLCSYFSEVEILSYIPQKYLVTTLIIFALIFVLIASAEYFDVKLNTFVQPLINNKPIAGHAVLTEGKYYKMPYMTVEVKEDYRQEFTIESGLVSSLGPEGLGWIQKTKTELPVTRMPNFIPTTKFLRRFDSKSFVAKISRELDRLQIMAIGQIIGINESQASDHMRYLLVAALKNGHLGKFINDNGYYIPNIDSLPAVLSVDLHLDEKDKKTINDINEKMQTRKNEIQARKEFSDSLIEIFERIKMTYGGQMPPEDTIRLFLVGAGLPVSDIQVKRIQSTGNLAAYFDGEDPVRNAIS